MTLQVQILIPAGQPFEAEIVTVDSYLGDVTKSEPAPLRAGVMHSFYATNTRSFEVREVVPAPVAVKPDSFAAPEA